MKKKVYIKTLEYPDYLDDTKRIKRILDDRGYIASLVQCEEMWMARSSELCAAWLSLSNDDERVYEEIRPYFDVIQ